LVIFFLLFERKKESVTEHITLECYIKPNKDAVEEITAVLRERLIMANHSKEWDAKQAG